MASEVEICNRALQKLGAKRITALDEDSVNARACNLAYPVIRDAELRAHPWNFATKRVLIAADSATPVFGRAYQYSLPSDFVRLLHPDAEHNTLDLDWQIEGRKILTDDVAPLEVRYSGRVTDPNQMDALFREALACSLAKELAEELTQSNSKNAALADDYEKIIRKAKRTNAIESAAQQPPEDEWVTIRS